MRRWVAAFSFAAWLLGAVTVAAAQSDEVRERRVGVHWQEGVPQVSFSARDLLGAAAEEKLQSGLAQTLTMQIYAFREGGSQPLAMSVRSCRVVFDLWEETYRVQVASVGSERTVRERDLEGVITRCLVARQERVGEASDFRAARGDDIYFAALVELNPLDEETVRRIRRWLARPGGRMAGEAFFGSFVSLFVNRRIGDAERAVRFRSQRVEVPR